MNISETATRQVDALLKGLASREVTSVALLEVLAVAPNRELPAEAWQTVATKYCATAIVEHTDLEALVAAANAMITPTGSGCQPSSCRSMRGRTASCRTYSTTPQC